MLSIWKLFKQYALYKDFKKFLQKQTVFLHVSAVATRERSLYKLKHSIIKTVSLYQMASLVLSSLSVVFLYKLMIFACWAFTDFTLLFTPCIFIKLFIWKLFQQQRTI